MGDGRSKIEDEASVEAFRLFVAISLPDGVKDEIEKAQREMRVALPGRFMRWTKREQFHLTLKFFGDVAASRVAELKAVLREACRPFSAMRLRAEAVGFFPDLRYPRVAWVGVRDDTEVLPKLPEVIEKSARHFAGGPAEKKFTGHVTLARIEGIRRPQAEILAKLALGAAGRFFGEWTADRIELIRSELSSSGARYTTLAEIPLGAGTG